MAVQFDFKKRLGSGNFGEVWLAIEMGLNATCAVKLIPPNRVINPNNFFHEAQILKAAEHDNVVRILETGTLPDGRIYVAMEYLKRGSLEDEASGSFVHLARARRVMIDALRGLEHAHDRGILHRDVKPANILVGDHFEGKLSDFGLALPAGLVPPAGGLKAYMYTAHCAPEVLAGGGSSIASEIYACGVTLYRLINGDAYLVPGPNLQHAIQNGAFPDRSRYRAFVPRRIRTVVNKAMNVDPTLRHRSAAELRHDLEQLTVMMNWQESLISRGVRWTGHRDKKLYEVQEVREATGLYSVIVRQGTSNPTLRRIGRLCATSLHKTAARKHSSRILQDLVLGR